MAKNKEVELQKYLDKKRRQKSRDDIMSQIAELTKSNSKSGISLIKKRIKKKAKEASFESKLFSEEDLPSEESDEPHAASEGQDPVGQEYTTPNAVEDEVCQLPAELLDCAEIQSEKQQILALNEQGVIRRFARTDEVVNQRKLMDIVYEEAEIVSRIKYSVVTFIQGDTGCGKTTQIPQFLYENGLAFDRMIALTQPRRFSAISISNRINYEANESISGYKIKYENSIKEHTKIKVLTEGVLLREIQSDFLLQQYSVVILDEVHERSTNMDVLVGLLSRIVRIRLEQKNPLRLVLMSATTDPEVFRRVLGRFSLINLTAKVYPVNVFYEDRTPDDYVDSAYRKIAAILDSEEKYVNNRKSRTGGASVPTAIKNDYKASILVFLTGKEDIYRLKARLDLLKDRLVALPLHSGLNKTEQGAVYDIFPVRKVVLATNIAETSITINDVVFVVDCGREKKKITDGNVVMYRTGFVSKSSAKQRMGRAGRTGPGVCYRLYSGDTYESFFEHNQPQIFAEPIDSTLLHLKCMGIKNVFGFPFIDQPADTAIQETLGSLEMLGALAKDWGVTKLGKKMCCYPLSPRYAKFLAAHENLQPAMFVRLVSITSILSCGVELKRNEDTAEYFQGATSDLIVLLRLFVAYLGAKSRRRYASQIRISPDKLEEVEKLAEYLLRIAGMEGELCAELSRHEETEICTHLYYLFADQLAISCGESYVFGEDEVQISSDSVDVKHQNVVFDYIVCGTKKHYIKNITAVPTSMVK